MLEKLKTNTDVIYKETKANCLICYQEHLCNILEFMKDFYPRLLENLNGDLDEIFPGICKKIDNDEDAIIQLVFCGLLICRRNNQYYVFLNRILKNVKLEKKKKKRGTMNFQI